MTLEAAIAETVEAAVRRAVEPLRQELAQLRAAKEPVAVSIAEAARRLGVSTKTVRRRIKAGELRTSRAGRRVLVDPSGLAPPPAAIARLAHDARSR